MTNQPRVLNDEQLNEVTTAVRKDSSYRAAVKTLQNVDVCDEKAVSQAAKAYKEAIVGVMQIYMMKWKIDGDRADVARQQVESALTADIEYSSGVTCPATPIAKPTMFAQR